MQPESSSRLCAQPPKPKDSEPLPAPPLEPLLGELEAGGGAGGGAGAGAGSDAGTEDAVAVDGEEDEVVEEVEGEVPSKPNCAWLC